MKGSRNIVGQNVRKLRSKLELSQPELAAKCQRLGWDISRDVIAKIEDQRRWVADFELFGLAKALDVTVTDLLPHSSIAFAKLKKQSALGNTKEPN